MYWRCECGWISVGMPALCPKCRLSGNVSVVYVVPGEGSNEQRDQQQERTRQHGGASGEKGVVV